MSKTTERFGRAVRKLRIAKGFQSQETFAYAAKIDRRYYSRIERGKANVSYEIVERLAAGLKISAAEFVSEVEAER